MHAVPNQHVSPNRLEGSLGDTPLARLLGECHKHLVTGAIHVRTREHSGAIELRVGFVDNARYGDLADDDAVDAMRALEHGDYELVQRLPDLAGELGAAAQFQGDTSEVPLVELMRHCEDNALSCVITVVRDFDRGQIRYRAGEIVEVELNGRRDDDEIVSMLRFEGARFRVSAPPLDLDISGWPSLRRAPTAPFFVEPTSDVDRAPAPAPAPTPDSAVAASTSAHGETRGDELSPWIGLPLVLLATGIAALAAWTLFLY